MFDVAIVGGSIAGNNLAYLLAKKNMSVAVVEEHKNVGYPKKCSGLISWRIRELVENFPHNSILNEIFKAKFFVRNLSLEIESEKPMYVIEREKLDQYLFRNAKKEGSEFFVGERVIEIEKKSKYIELHTNKREIKSKMVVGADGVNSFVAKSFGLTLPNNLYIGIQGTVRDFFQNDFVEIYIDPRYSKGFFSWVIPENTKYARIGLVTKKHPSFFYKNFLNYRIGRYVKPDTFGLIRIGLIKKSVSERCLLVGDAACQIKPFSGGGVIYSLIATKIASKCIELAIKKNEFNEKFLRKNYEIIWKGVLEKSILKGLILRKLSNIYPLFTLAKIAKKIIEKLDVDFI